MDFKHELSVFVSELTGLDSADIYSAIEIPPDNKLGDYAFPCFKLSKQLKKAPNAIAQELKEKAFLPEFIEEIRNTGPFLNFFLNKSIFASSVINEVLLKKELFGSSDIGGGRTIVLDFSSPNVAKRFHVGHLYSTLIGNSLYKIFNFLGYKSVGINHLGDWGTQFGKLIVAYINWGDKEIIEKYGIEEMERLYVRFHDEAENNPALEDDARAWLVKMQQHENEAIKLWQWFNDISIPEYEKQYDRLNIHFDSYKGESFYNDKMNGAVEELRDKNLLVESDGAQIVDLEKYKMPPCLILRRDGGTIYPTRDIAAALYRKNTYDFYKAVYVTDMRQSLHFAQWFKVIGLMGYEWENDLVHVPYGLLSLEDGALSSRKGKVILLTDLLDEAVIRVKKVIDEKNPNLENKEQVAEQVGIGAVIFSSLYNSRIKDNVFTLDKVLSFEGETGPYVQYTCARAASILEKAGNTAGLFDSDSIEYTALNDEASFETIKLLYSFQEKIMLSAERYEPFLISRYLVDLSQAFNKFYHDNPILNADSNVRTARLALVLSVKTVISVGLSLLGISAPNKM